MAYTLFGGIRAIMWTDVVQFAIFMGGAWLALGLLLSQIDGGWSGMLDVARHATTTTGAPIDKTQIFDFTFSFTKESVFWAAVLCGLFQSMAAFGTDQDMTQRMLTCRKPSLAKRGMILTGFFDFMIVFTFLLIGLALYAFNVQSRFAAGIADTDHVFTKFIAGYLPMGVKGLLLSAVFAAAMSSLDSTLGALSSSAIIDLYKAYVRPNASDRHYLFVSRLFVVLFTIALVIVAYVCRDLSGVLKLAFKIVSYTYGGLLGVFLLGLLTKRGRNVTNVVAMVSSVGVVVLLRNVTPVAWHWMIIIGTVWTFGFAVIFPGKPRTNEQAAG
jgi:SSS family transporter